MSSYHCELIIITNHEHELKYKILVIQISPPIEDLDIQANYCKKYFLSGNHQKLQWSCRNEDFFV